jgi:hypothetical protein
MAYPVYPGVERRIALKVCKALEQFNEHLLQHVIGIEFRPKRLEHKIVHLVLVIIE